MADFEARASQGHIERAKFSTTNESVRCNHKLIMHLPLQLGFPAAPFQATQTLVGVATAEANSSSDERDEKELENEKKSLATRIIRYSINGALLDIATFYHEIMMMQSGNTASMITSNMCGEIESYAASHLEHSKILKINAIRTPKPTLHAMQLLWSPAKRSCAN